MRPGKARKDRRDSRVGRAVDSRCRDGLDVGDAAGET